MDQYLHAYSSDQKKNSMTPVYLVSITNKVIISVVMSTPIRYPTWCIIARDLGYRLLVLRRVCICLRRVLLRLANVLLVFAKLCYDKSGDFLYSPGTMSSSLADSYRALSSQPPNSTCSSDFRDTCGALPRQT